MTAAQWPENLRVAERNALEASRQTLVGLDIKHIIERYAKELKRRKVFTEDDMGEITNTNAKVSKRKQLFVDLLVGKYDNLRRLKRSPFDVLIEELKEQRRYAIVDTLYLARESECAKLRAGAQQEGEVKSCVSLNSE